MVGFGTRSRRRGAAAVELAACIPVIVLLVFGSLEACGMIFLKQTLASASYEGIREAVRQGSTETSIRAKCQQVLDNRGVDGSAITITVLSIPTLEFSDSDTTLSSFSSSSTPTFAEVEPGDPIRVTITAPSNSNRLLVTSFIRNINVSSSAVMLKE